jgi:hypothetical protein
VMNGGDSGLGTLRQAILDATSGDTINFAASITTINLTSGELLINKNLTINGPGPNLLTVQRSSGMFFRIFDIASASITATISGLTITSGRAFNSNGGGISNVGALTITNCAISANTTDSFGGGIYNAGLLTITASTISANVTGSPEIIEGRGGGIYNGGRVTITNSTISGNSALSTGGIYNGGGGIMTVTASTISGNVCGRGNSGGGGGIINGGTLTARNTIIAMNTDPTMVCPDVCGALTSQGFNLIGNNTGATITNAQPSDQIGTAGSPIDPLLGPLQDNGGPMFTQALQSGSTAIDKGHSSGLPTDQRGFTRPVDFPGIPNATGGDGSDIGAFEVQAPLPTILANISTRLLVETGDNVLIGGFIITGTQPKKVIVRAIGPSLPLVGALADPVLELRNSSGGLIASNDNWRSNQEAEIIATGIPPTNDLESAIVATLPANNSAYTAILRGVNNGTGIGVVEAYDLNRTVDSKLANISTRGFVQTGDNVLIGGLIVLGQDPLRVIVRAIGPSLNLPGKLADPILELRDGNGALIRSNDNWRSDQEAEIIATGIPPANDLESAIVATLPANGASYTAIVRGVNGTTGVAVVEVYALN